MFTLLTLSIQGQNNYYVITDNSDLVQIDQNNCSTSTICNCGIYIQDIALTPDEKMYASNGKNIFEIDLLDCSNLQITLTPVTDTLTSGGNWINSLVAIDNKFLFAVGTNALLYKVNIENGTSWVIDTLIENIDGIDYWYGSGGDLTWYKGNLLLVTAMNELVEIKLDISNNYITSVHRKGIIQTPGLSIYGVLTVGTIDCNNDNLKLIGFEGYEVYSINPDNANAQLTCDSMLYSNAYGATSYSETQKQVYTPILNFPNIFTPNFDGVNDFYTSLDFEGVSNFEFYIVNRWGNTVYFSKNNPINWNGENNENEVVEGVYFYVIKYSDFCDKEYKNSGFLTLIK